MDNGLELADGACKALDKKEDGSQDDVMMQRIDYDDYDYLHGGQQPRLPPMHENSKAMSRNTIRSISPVPADDSSNFNDKTTSIKNMMNLTGSISFGGQATIQIQK